MDARHSSPKPGEGTKMSDKTGKRGVIFAGGTFPMARREAPLIRLTLLLLLIFSSASGLFGCEGSKAIFIRPISDGDLNPDTENEFLPDGDLMIDGDGASQPDGDTTWESEEVNPYPDGDPIDYPDWEPIDRDSEADFERIDVEFDLPPVCTPGTLSCSDSWVIRCASSGHWSVEMDCTKMVGLEPLAEGHCVNGVCKSSAGPNEICMSGTRRCVDATHSEVCKNAAGAAQASWIALATCTDSQYCLAGLCFEKACTPGSKRCVDRLAETCNADGLSWTPRVSCEGQTQRCINGDCLETATPEDCSKSYPIIYRCVSEKQPQYCNATAKQWVDLETCKAGETCMNSGCHPICPVTDRNCPKDYYCDSSSSICKLAPGKCLVSDDCPGAHVECEFPAGASVGNCKYPTNPPFCQTDANCEGCTYCDNYQCLGYKGASCRTPTDCPDPSRYACIFPSERCGQGYCQPNCLVPGATNCKSQGMTCDTAPASPTYGSCISPIVCVPCADDDDCGEWGRCGWREDLRYKITSGCCEWPSHFAPKLCHEKCPAGKACFPNADACGLTSCPSGQCVQPNGTCGPCTCTNTSPYCTAVPGDNSGQGTCCPGYLCDNTPSGRCMVKDCYNNTCMKADGNCGPCTACTNPSSCGLGLPPCCMGSSCNIPSGATQGTCGARGCYGKTCTPLLGDCCLETPNCLLANVGDTTGTCF